VGLFDELNKIAEAQRDPPLKKTLKNIALATLGGAVGTGITMAMPHLMKATGLAQKFEKISPAARMKYIAPAVGVGSMALTAAMLALQHEMTKKDEKKDV
jgi:hypothetical protein